MKNIDAKFIARSALIAAVYAVITIMLAPISYGQIQVRLSEMLTVLAFLDPAAIPGLYIGCMIANWYGGLGPIDIFFGSLLTLAAAASTYLIAIFFKRFSHKIYHYYGPLAAFLPIVIFNAFGVALILNIVLKLPFLISALYVGVGETIAVYIFGYPLLQVVMRLGIYEGS